jgi:hypothetical protein
MHFLGSSVVRKPADLVSHMRRVWLFHDIGDAEGATGAAVDLFIAVQDKGTALRQRVLRILAAELHSCECYVALHEALDGQLSRHDPRVARTESLLCRPARGSFDFVRRSPTFPDIAAIADELDWSIGPSESGEPS